jgi:hypothetical protein
MARDVIAKKATTPVPPVDPLAALRKPAVPPPPAGWALNNGPQTIVSHALKPGAVQPQANGNTYVGPTVPGAQTAAPAGGGYGGGGGGGAAAAGPAVTPMTFDDFIAKDFGYNQTRNEGDRRLQDFDAETARMQQETQSEQAMRRAVLQQTLQELGGDTANDAANRGILRSGLYMQNQDRVDQAGVRGNQDIESILTQLIGQRAGGRVQQEQGNRSALNDVLSQLSQQFNSGLQIA